ncbi:MAG: DUF1345 domain-containing protein [Acidimicrobiales bacterium]
MKRPSVTTAARRVGVAVIAGCVVGPLTALFVAWQAAPLLGWDAAACIFLVWVWGTITGLDAETTAEVAAREDPSTALADLIIIVAGLACLAAVGIVLIKAAHSHGGVKALLIGIGVLSVALSWASLHTVYTLRYARAYYRTKEPGGIDFNSDDPPDFLDFAYVAFTIGLTFQVSDTDIGTKQIRRLALRHALLAFLFGAVILGLTINVVASLLH